MVDRGTARRRRPAATPRRRPAASTAAAGTGGGAPDQEDRQHGDDEERDAAPAPQLALATVTIALSWAIVHTAFALHYAHEFYAADPETGEDAGGHGRGQDRDAQRRGEFILPTNEEARVEISETLPKSIRQRSLPVLASRQTSTSRMPAT